MGTIANPFIMPLRSPVRHLWMEHATDPLLGLRVRIVIQEDGGDHPLGALPPGTIVKRLTATRGGPYHLVRLDSAVTCVRAKTKEEWKLRDLVIWPSFVGESLDRLLLPPQRIPERLVGLPLLVGIANVVEPLDERADILDAARVDYFARGYVERA